MNVLRNPVTWILLLQHTALPFIIILDAWLFNAHWTYFVPLCTEVLAAVDAGFLMGVCWTRFKGRESQPV